MDPKPGIVPSDPGSEKEGGMGLTAAWKMGGMMSGWKKGGEGHYTHTHLPPPVHEKRLFLSVRKRGCTASTR